MSRSPHSRLVLCAVCLSIGVAEAGAPKTPISRSTSTVPRVIRIATGGGTLIFERTADSPSLRGQPQSWIALWQSSEKEPFYVFGQVLQSGTDAAIAIATLGDSQVQFFDEIARIPGWNVLHKEANWVQASIQRPTVVDAAQRWVFATKSTVLGLLGLGDFADSIGGDDNIVATVSPYLPPGGGAASVGNEESPMEVAFGYVAVVAPSPGSPCTPGHGGPPPVPPPPLPPPPPPCPIVPGHCCDPTCRMCPPNDCDGDGITDDQDSDIDGDGIPNWDDPVPAGCSGICCDDPDACECLAERDQGRCCGEENTCCGDTCDDGYTCTVDYCNSDTGECESDCISGLDASVVAEAECTEPSFRVELDAIEFRGNGKVNIAMPGGTGRWLGCWWNVRRPRSPSELGLASHRQYTSSRDNESQPSNCICGWATHHSVCLASNFR